MKRPVQDLAAELSQLTKEQLIERIIKQESKSTATQHPKKRKDRPMDFSLYSQQHVAMKVAYLGWDYHGYASQISFKSTSTPQDCYQISHLPTIEEHLFKALMTAKLIENPTTANYSRCGRTDAGVSATGQVVGVTIRSSKKKTGQDDQEAKDLPVAIMLNSLLPPEIRVLEVVSAPDGFTARFDCKHREYHYYFPRQNLDIEKMREAASMLLGEHDFRNFCKRDPSKDVQNFVRTILEARIQDVGEHTESPHDMFKFVIRGTAFLYHQVRCTMAILFLVGQGKDEPKVVSDLMENLHEEWRPTYQMASEIPLVLVDCGFEKIKFSSKENSVQDLYCNSAAKTKTQRHLFGLWRDKMAQALTLKWLLDPGTAQDDGPSKVQTILRKPQAP